MLTLSETAPRPPFSSPAQIAPIMPPIIDKSAFGTQMDDLSCGGQRWMEMVSRADLVAVAMWRQHKPAPPPPPGGAAFPLFLLHWPSSQCCIHRSSSHALSKQVVDFRSRPKVDNDASATLVGLTMQGKCCQGPGPISLQPTAHPAIAIIYRHAIAWGSPDP